MSLPQQSTPRSAEIFRDRLTALMEFLGTLPQEQRMRAYELYDAVIYAIPSFAQSETKQTSTQSATGAMMLPEDPTPEMIASVSTILQPYAAKLVWKRMLETATKNPADRSNDHG